ncbi:MAG TPA: AAA family ATPase [Actinomycetota bacterium]|nr:AAA family ATPase [Actinomycetota bacterium]
MVAKARMFVDKIVVERPKEGADAYPFSTPAIKDLKSLSFKSPVTFFVGENASGKSTLLEAIALASGFNPEGGSRNFTFALRPSESQLHESLVIHRSARPKTGFFLRAESFFNVATQVDDLDQEIKQAVYGGKSLHEQSHGESFLAVVANRFGPNGLYLLDEPESALSFRGQLALLVRINELSAQNCQFIVATHSPVLMAYPGAEIFSFTEEGLTKTDYEDTDHYQMMSSFYESRERFFKHLFEE